MLVIKLGALGDVVQALGPLAAIRDHHAKARITLLTTEPYAEFLAASGLVDDVWLDGKPKAWNLLRLMHLRAGLRSRPFGRVYDLQTSDRSSSYFRLFASPKPQWSGIAKGCSHPHDNPKRDLMHTLERQGQQLLYAGIVYTPKPSLDWAEADLSRFDLPAPYVLLVPGGAPHRPEKRWPGERYGALAGFLAARGLTPVVLGTAAEAQAAAEIAEACPTARDLTGQTSLLEIAVLARGAAGAVGNDTGPMHIAAVAGCPCLTLYSRASDPKLCGQRGPRARVLRVDDLADLQATTVMGMLEEMGVNS